MDSFIDDVYELIRLGRGDLGRLEHIKSALEDKRTLYTSDKKYIEELTSKYLSAKNQSNSKESAEEKYEESRIDDISETIFCGKCGASLQNDSNFCVKCGASLQNDLKPNQKNIVSKHKPRKGLIFLGIVLVIIASSVFVVPVNDMGLTTADVSSLCKSPLGVMGQAFGGETAVNNCAASNILTTMAVIFGIFGLILVVIGFVMKKISPKTEIIATAIILSTIAFIGSQIVLPFPYGLIGSITSLIIIAIISKKKIQKYH